MTPPGAWCCTPPARSGPRCCTRAACESPHLARSLMNDKRLVRISKFLSRHLRHAPEDIGLELQPGGWVPVADLLAGCARAGLALSRAELQEVVDTSDKQRFSFDDTGERIRANQGHSTE